MSVPPLPLRRSMSGVNEKKKKRVRGTQSIVIPPIQNRQIDRAEVAEYTILVNFSTDQDYSVVFVSRVARFPNCFSLLV